MISFFNRGFKAFLFLALFVLVSPSAQAQEVKPVSIGVVDVQTVLQESKAGKDIQRQLDKKRKEYQKQISSKEENLRSAEQEILSRKDKLSQDQLAEERQKFEKNVISAQKLVQQNKRSLEAGFAQALAGLRNDIRETISEVAKERKYAMVLSQESVIIAEKSMDITEDVIKKLDKRITSVKIDWSAGNDN